MNNLTAEFVMVGAQKALEERFQVDVTICVGLYDSIVEVAERITEGQSVVILLGVHKTKKNVFFKETDSGFRIVLESTKGIGQAKGIGPVPSK